MSVLNVAASLSGLIMSDKGKKLECVKQEIRSVLLSQPKDMTIPALLSDYMSIIGRRLPFTEFGYSSPDEFLRSIPDVVTMNWSKRYNSFMLRAVADESTKHIEKLVSKQKTTKATTLAARRMTPAVSTPPRFSKAYNNKNSCRAYLSAVTRSEIYNVAKEHKNGLSLPNFLTAFRRKYGKDLVYKNYGFLTLEDCLNSIPEIFLRCEYGEMRVYPIIEKSAEESSKSVYQGSTSSNAQKYDNKENKSTNVLLTENASAFGGNMERNKTMNSLDSFSSAEDSSQSFGITPSVKEQCKQVMKKNPHGVWVSQFPATFEKLTGCSLDHCKLGYYNLIDLFSKLPEIFRIEAINDCKDDWMLFDASSSVGNVKPKEGFKLKSPCGRKTSKDIYSVITNIRLLLQANCEGISLDDFCGFYEANCDEQLDLNDFGFDSLPMFLTSLTDRVPLKIDYSKGKSKVYYKNESSDSVSDHMSPHLELPSEIPCDAVVGCTEYELQNIPGNLNPDQFFPVYLSAVVDPSHMYIQLHGEDTFVRLGNLMDELQSFYCEKENECYRVPQHYIISGIVCAAVWPGDGHWHRIHISSVPSSDSVVAFFMDYGTKERIRSDDLRFLRKKFVELPAQAIRSHLCRLTPFHGEHWDPDATHILNLFGMKPLMACVTQTSVLEESVPLVLCDVSGEHDVFLNDLLVSKGYAKFATDIENQKEPHYGEHSYLEAEEIMLPVNNRRTQMLPTTQQIPILPGGVSENPVHTSWLKASSMKNYENIQNSSNPVKNSVNNFNIKRIGDSLDTSVVNDLQTGVNRSVLQPCAEIFAAQPVASLPEPSFSSPAVDFSQNAPYHVFHGSDSEVFNSDEEVDDDDNPEVNSISKRYVKRLDLDEGYNSVHMVVINDTPYMSSGDITYLLWNHNDPDFVRRKLKNKEIFIPNTTLKEVGYEQLFYQLERFQVRGVKIEVSGNHCITLFPFKNVVDILNIFGHPSVAVRNIIDDELLCFNPLDPFWKTISEDEFEEKFSTEANKEKQQKVSLYELKASLQALKFRKQTLKTQLYGSSTVPGLCEEIEETEAHCVDIERQIKDLQVHIVSYPRMRVD